MGRGPIAPGEPSLAALIDHARERLDALSAREHEIVVLMADGLSNQGIGERLFLSTRTVESHVRAIFQKLELPASEGHRRVLVVLAYLSL